MPRFEMDDEKAADLLEKPKTKKEEVFEQIKEELERHTLTDERGSQLPLEIKSDEDDTSN